MAPEYALVQVGGGGRGGCFALVVGRARQRWHGPRGRRYGMRLHERAAERMLGREVRSMPRTRESRVVCGEREAFAQALRLLRSDGAAYLEKLRRVAALGRVRGDGGSGHGRRVGDSVSWRCMGTTNARRWPAPTSAQGARARNGHAGQRAAGVGPRARPCRWSAAQLNPRRVASAGDFGHAAWRVQSRESPRVARPPNHRRAQASTRTRVLHTRRLARGRDKLRIETKTTRG